MTVEELIDILLKQDKKQEVYFRDFDSGWLFPVMDAYRERDYALYTDDPQQMDPEKVEYVKVTNSATWGGERTFETLPGLLDVFVIEAEVTDDGNTADNVLGASYIYIDDDPEDTQYDDEGDNDDPNEPEWSQEDWDYLWKKVPVSSKSLVDTAKTEGTIVTGTEGTHLDWDDRDLRDYDDFVHPDEDDFFAE